MDEEKELTPQEWKKFHEDTKLFQSLESCRYYCQCGHSVTISQNQDKTMCDWCKRWVYKNPVEQSIHNDNMEAREKELKRYRFRKEINKWLN